MKGLSLCLITKDEEKNIAACIQSFQGLFSQLIIVDTGSTDNTKEIAEKMGAQVYDFQWVNDFAAARNFALSKASGEYLMMVDADDRINEGEKAKLINHLNSLSEQVEIIFLPYLLDSNTQQKNLFGYLPRIWKKSLGLIYKLAIHEYLDVSSVGKGKEYWPFSIVHSKEILDYKKGFLRNIKILEEAVKKDPGETRYLFFLANDNQYSDNFDEAVKWYEKFIDSKPKSIAEVNRAYIGKALCFWHLGKMEDAKKSFQMAIEVDARFIEPYLNLGHIALSEKNYQLAVEMFMEASKCTVPNTHLFINKSFYQGVAQQMIEKTLRKMREESQ